LLAQDSTASPLQSE
ncbi:hypothetical protein D030_2679B, partial [Vibrio parahaemolyticus AQ3810]